MSLEPSKRFLVDLLDYNCIMLSIVAAVKSLLVKDAILHDTNDVIFEIVDAFRFQNYIALPLWG